MNLLYPTAASEQVSAVAARKCMEEMVREEWTVLAFGDGAQRKKDRRQSKGLFLWRYRRMEVLQVSEGSYPAGVGWALRPSHVGIQRQI